VRGAAKNLILFISTSMPAGNKPEPAQNSSI